MLVKEVGLFMSLWIYGAVRLNESDSQTRGRLKGYWQKLTMLHELWVNIDSPEFGVLEPSIAKAWPEPEWLRFSLSVNSQEKAADGLMLASARRAEMILSRNETFLSERNVWTRVPQWCCLNFMLWHQDIVEACLVVENASGDADHVCKIVG